MRSDIIEAIAEEDGRPFYVGGCVRDSLMGLTPTDFDIEVFGMNLFKLRQILSHYGTINEVGESFGILLLKTPNGEKMEFSVPRRERKVGRGHRDFLTESDPNMSVAEAARRRDFTVNAIYRDAVTGEIVDPYDGRTDIERGYLRAVNWETFGDDPLRPLRGMQFAGRFNFAASPETAAISRNLVPEEKFLPRERVFGEWYKWATLSHFPSAGWRFLSQTHWVDLYPAIRGMDGVPQDRIHHPEGDVGTHVRMVCDAMADICDHWGVRGEDRAVLMFAALCHDMGKPSTTTFEADGRIKSKGHADAGIPIARDFLLSIGCFDRIIERVLSLVENHMFPVWDTSQLSRRTVRRLKVRLQPATVDELILLMQADSRGTLSIAPGEKRPTDRLRELAEELPPRIEPLVGGRDIMEAFGIHEGREIGRLKTTAFNAQLDEEFADTAGGLEWLRKTQFANS